MSRIAVSRTVFALAVVLPAVRLDAQQVAPAASAPAVATAAGAPRLDASGLQPYTLVYAMSTQDQLVGTLTQTLTRGAADGRPSFTLSTRLASPAGLATEQDLTFDAPFAARTSRFKQEAPNASNSYDLTLRDGRATGQFAAQGQSRDVALAVPEGTMLPGMEDVAIALLDLAVDTNVVFRVADARRGVVRAQTVRVLGEERVQVEAGAFDAVRLELTDEGGRVTRMWVRKAAPHVQLRAERGPVRLELKELR